ncbi:MAG: chemotaxis-specific protein-glutamate methyltransferase CheB, partial [Asticcacaulis sp.]
PNMNGLDALPKMIAAKPGLKVLMSSTLTTQGASVTIRALELGAADYIAKPEASRIGGAEGFRQELMAKARALCGRTRGVWPALPPGTNAPVSAAAAPPIQPRTSPTSLRVATPRASTFTGVRKVSALLIGASTGGPPALRNFLVGLGPDWKLPILIVQHMPATFTAILAEHLDKALSMTVVEAKQGMSVEAKHVYIAPGDYHMTLKGSEIAPTLHLDQSAPVNWCRPAVDPMFKSAVDIYGKNLMAVVLTGMGHDGRDGAQAIVNAGGLVMAQDEASSVVWGMPGAVAEAGLAEIIRPVDGLSAACKAISRGEKA